jgi:prepilin-type N-terminal cleavage/methylation domain-containing protein
MVAKNVTKLGSCQENKMRSKRESGFSLIELLIVVVVIGVVAAIAIPAFQKGIWAAENGTTFAALRTISSTQVNFFSQNSRFARLTELNPLLGNSLGVTTGDRVVKNRYTYEMSPVTPTDTELKNGFTITATRSVTGDVTYKYALTQTGQIEQILP